MPSFQSALLLNVSQPSGRFLVEILGYRVLILSGTKKNTDQQSANLFRCHAL